MKKYALNAMSITLGALAILGCRSATPPPTERVYVPQPAPIQPAFTPEPAMVSPGQGEPSPSEAANFFSQICLEGQAPESLGMVRNPATGTYSHPEYNISVKKRGEICSVVFGSNSGAENIQQAFPGLEAGVNPVRETGASLYGQSMYAVAFTSTESG